MSTFFAARESSVSGGHSSSRSSCLKPVSERTSSKRIMFDLSKFPHPDADFALSLYTSIAIPTMHADAAASKVFPLEAELCEDNDPPALRECRKAPVYDRIELSSPGFDDFQSDDMARSDKTRPIQNRLQTLRLDLSRTD